MSDKISSSEVSARSDRFQELTQKELTIVSGGFYDPDHQRSSFVASPRGGGAGDCEGFEVTLIIVVRRKWEEVMEDGMVGE
jgi:hypothetical protein